MNRALAFGQIVQGRYNVERIEAVEACNNVSICENQAVPMEQPDVGSSANRMDGSVSSCTAILHRRRSPGVHNIIDKAVMQCALPTARDAAHVAGAPDLRVCDVTQAQLGDNLVHAPLPLVIACLQSGDDEVSDPCTHVRPPSPACAGVPHSAGSRTRSERA